MKELIERIECAEGPDRELDALILIVALEATSAKFGLNTTFEAVQSTVDGDNWSVVTSVDGKKADRQSPPPFTASLDAAMTLVPEGSEFGLSWSRMNSDMGGRNWRTMVGKQRASGRTPALAICHAALKARGE